MQLDMHYYGTYAMARAAGIKPEHSLAIATAAQYVDDSNTAAIELRGGAFLACSATAHHPIDSRNIDPKDQREVWIPFHFLPGNAGETFEERLICKMDSSLAHDLIEYALSHATETYGPMLIGVVAHVYADTFSHYGFSGISSDINSVDNNSITPRINTTEILRYVKEKAADFFEKRTADIADTIKLGHGGVATYPDRPYLRWNFHYSDGRFSGERDNPATFTSACEKLHSMFVRFGEVAPAYANPDHIVPFEEIRNAVVDVLVREGTMKDRIAAWQAGAVKGKLFRDPVEIPEYQSERFVEDMNQLGNYANHEVKEKFIFQFMQAATIHRNFVLRELLPSNGLQILVL